MYVIKNMRTSRKQIYLPVENRKIYRPTHALEPKRGTTAEQMLKYEAATGQTQERLHNKLPSRQKKISGLIQHLRNKK